MFMRIMLKRNYSYKLHNRVTSSFIQTQVITADKYFKFSSKISNGKVNTLPKNFNLHDQR